MVFKDALRTLYLSVFFYIAFFIVSINAGVPYFPHLTMPEAKKAHAGNGGDKAIILIVVCPSRPDFFSLYGGDKIPTDNLELLAKEGLLFTRMYANAPWTRAGSASVLTGRYASRHKCQQDTSRLPRSVLTISEHLKKKGYKTGGFVANGNASSIAHLHRGFDTYKDPKTYWGRLGKGNQVVDEALSWIGKVKKERFFALLFFVDPHDPYRAPPEYEKRYLKGLENSIRREAAWEYNNNYPELERRSIVAIYRAAWDYTDDQIGRFLRELKKLELYNRATVIVTGDHAEGFGEHGWYLHAHHLENEFIHIPLLIKRPGLT
ncbi:MAG: sulfatase, partial [Chitinispirillia bacterium]